MAKTLQKRDLFCVSISLSNNTQTVVNACNIPNISQGYGEFKKLSCVGEVVILQKCNCTEIFIWGAFDLEKIVKTWKSVSIAPEGFGESDIALYRENKCIEHLLQVSSGLKSVIIGDGQVLGQVRLALTKSKKFNASGPVMEVLFRSAKRVAISVKEKTLIGIGNVSVGRQAVELLQNVNDDHLQRVLVVGCGAMGSLIANVLHEKGFEYVDVTNRTESRADKLIESGRARTKIKFGEYLDKLEGYDAVFFCLSSVLSYEESEKINTLSYVPKIIDVGNPQNTILLASLNKNVSIYSMATIKKLTAQRYRDRIAQIKKASEIIKEGTDDVYRAIEKELISVEVGLNLELSKERLDKNLAHVASLRSVFEKSFRDYLQEKENYTEVHTPCVVPISTDPPRNNAGEELFSVQWYERKLFLRQSNQMYKQMLVLSGMKKIFEYGPFWREETSPTARHLSEAWGLDIEMQLRKGEGIKTLLALAGKVLAFSSGRLSEKKFIARENVIEKEIQSISYDEVFEIVTARIDVDYSYGDDLGYSREYELAKFLKESRGWDIFAIIRYPNLTKKFYTREIDNHYTESFDIIYRGWEVCSGAVRETDVSRIIEKMKLSGVNPEHFHFYLDYFRTPVSHGGFCLGIDRIVAKLLSYNTVEDVVLFPRSQTHIIP